MSRKYCILVDNKKDSTRIQKKLIDTGRRWPSTERGKGKHFWYPTEVDGEKYFIYFYETDNDICFSKKYNEIETKLLIEKELNAILGIKQEQLELEF